jgi:CBS domain-containing protein
MINKNISVKELMTSDVIFVKPEDCVNKVAEIFGKNNIHHIPVINEEGIVEGIVSSTDFNRIQHGMTLFKIKDAEAFNSALFRSLLVKEVMTTKVVKMNWNDTVEMAIGIFKENLFHAMPVVDDENKLVGILTTFDLLNFAFNEPSLIA